MDLSFNKPIKSQIHVCRYLGVNSAYMLHPFLYFFYEDGENSSTDVSQSSSLDISETESEDSEVSDDVSDELIDALKGIIIFQKPYEYVPLLIGRKVNYSLIPILVVPRRFVEGNYRNGCRPTPCVPNWFSDDNL